MPGTAPRIFPWPWSIATFEHDGHEVQIFQGTDETAFFYTTLGMSVDYDGGIGAYHLPTASSPGGKGTGLGADHISNAADGKLLPPPAGSNWDPTKWKQLVINTASTPKVPYTYTLHGDPNFCVSKTTLSDQVHHLPDQSTAKWVDAMTVPYIVLPWNLGIGGVLVGDLATVYNETRGTVVHAIYADVGNKGKIGEGSRALFDALHAHDQDKITWVVFPRSRRNPRWPVPLSDINAAASGLFSAWGGTLRIADRRVDMMLGMFDTLKARDQLTPPLRSAQGLLISAQASLRASKGTPYPHFLAGAGPRVQILSERSDAIADLSGFINQVSALPGGSMPSFVATSLLDLARRARTALEVPD